MAGITDFRNEKTGQSSLLSHVSRVCVCVCVWGGGAAEVCLLNEFETLTNYAHDQKHHYRNSLLFIHY
jgi:hypothetical protein